MKIHEKFKFNLSFGLKTGISKIKKFIQIQICKKNNKHCAGIFKIV